MKLPGTKKWEAEQALRKSLAIEDLGMLGVAGQIDLNHTQAVGDRETMFNELAVVSERFCLDPSTVSEILHDLFPDLRDISPPVHTGDTRA